MASRPQEDTKRETEEQGQNKQKLSNKMAGLSTNIIITKYE